MGIGMIVRAAAYLGVQISVIFNIGGKLQSHTLELGGR